MSALTVEQNMRAQCDHLAAYRGALVGSISSRDENALWQLIDNSGDILYENRVKGASITTIDTDLSNIKFGQAFSTWFSLHNQYYAADAGISGVNDLSTALQYYRWRVPEYFNAFHLDAFNGRSLPLANVAPNQDTIIGTATVGGGGSTITFTAGETVDTAKASSLGGILGIKVGPTISSDIVLNDLKLKVNDTDIYTMSSFTVDTVGPPPAYTAGQYIPLLVQTLDGSANTTTGVVPVASTNGFFPGQHVLICSDAIDFNAAYDGSPSMLDLTQEVAVVISVDSGNAITVGKVGQTGTPVAGLRNAFVSGDKVYPMFKDLLVNSTSGSGTAGEYVTFHYLPDRVLDLAYVP